MRDSNDKSIIRVLKSLGLVSASNEPTQRYTEFMTPIVGPSVLASAIQEVWAPFFEHSHEPHREDVKTLQNYVNIHSGGSEATIAYQIQTFKAACDYADFMGEPGKDPVRNGNPEVGGKGGQPNGHGSGKSEPTIHIDLHIHLPENKARRDYEYILEDIAKYIFGRNVGSRSDD